MPGFTEYLNDHLAGAAAAIQLAERLHLKEPDTELGRLLRRLVAEIDEDRVVLERVLSVLGGSPNQMKRASALGVERLSTLRMSLPILGAGSPEVARLEEVEVLVLGIEGKRLLWRALGAVASLDDRLDAFDFSELERRARSQRDRLERIRIRASTAAFGSP